MYLDGNEGCVQVWKRKNYGHDEEGIKDEMIQNRSGGF